MRETTGLQSLRAPAERETPPVGRQCFDGNSIDGDVVADFHWNREEVRWLKVGVSVDEPL